MSLGTYRQTRRGMLRRILPSLACGRRNLGRVFWFSLGACYMVSGARFINFGNTVLRTQTEARVR